jgi:hypothetical protein
LLEELFELVDGFFLGDWVETVIVSGQV